MNLLKNQFPSWLDSCVLGQNGELISFNLKSRRKIYLFKYILSKYKNNFNRRFLLFNAYLHRYFIRFNKQHYRVYRKHKHLIKRVLRKRYVRKYWLRFIRLFVLKRKIIKRKERLIESLLLNPRQRKFRFFVSRITARINKKTKLSRLKLRRRRTVFFVVRKRRHWYPKAQYRKLKRLKRQRYLAKHFLVRLKQKTIRQGKRFCLVLKRRRLRRRFKQTLRQILLKRRIKHLTSYNQRRLKKVNPMYIKLKKPKYKRTKFLRRPRFKLVWYYFLVFRRLNRFYKGKRRVKGLKKFFARFYNRIKIINKKLAFTFYKKNTTFFKRLRFVAKGHARSLAFLRRKFLLTSLSPILKNSKINIRRKRKNSRLRGVRTVRRLYKSMFSVFFKSRNIRLAFRPIVYYLSYKFLRNEGYGLRLLFDKQRWLNFISKFKYRKLFRLLIKFKAFYLFKKLKLNYVFSSRVAKINELGMKKAIYFVFFNKFFVNGVYQDSTSYFTGFGNGVSLATDEDFRNFRSVCSISSLRKFYGKPNYYGLSNYLRRKLRKKRLRRVSVKYFLQRSFNLKRKLRVRSKFSSTEENLLYKRGVKKWWPKNWRTLPRRRQKMLRKYQSLFRLFKAQSIRKSLRLTISNGSDHYDGRFHYWEARILRRRWRSFFALRRRRRKYFGIFFSKIPLINAFRSSRIFCFGLKLYLKHRKKYFMYQSTRRLIHQRDKLYFSKWGYVKFRKTRHNLFITIYDRWGKLLFHTSAWAFASRRDPDRFSYKSLVFAARKLAAKLWKLRFKRINVRINSPISFQIRIFLKTLKIKRIKVLTILNFIKIPHNGLRPQKSRTQK